jgi:hypothetical protein
MAIKFHPHAFERISERGATEEEVRITIENGERFAAKFGRTGFRRNFACIGETGGARKYSTKQIEAYAVDENGWLVITVIVKYF